jgi:hypothetical protein
MRFSEAFNIQRGETDDWFDPHLTIDTRLFIDPLLLLELGGDWAGVHDELIEHFVHCYGLIAKATGPKSLSAQAARRLLTFPEPFELGLGYTALGTDGAGSGDRFAGRMADGIAVAISAGLDNPEHIEEIGILNEGIGADRVSDATANVLKAKLISYTQDVANRHNLELVSQKVRHARVNLAVGRWVDEEVLLPKNPETGKPIILVPQALLNDLPTLNADDWFDSHLNEDIRLQLNLTVGAQVRKADIVSWARRHPDRVREWARQQTSRDDLTGYNFERDPLGVVQWDGVPAQWAAENPIDLPPVLTEADLISLVEKTIEQFRHFIEDQRGWSLLLNDDGSSKREEAAQLAYLGMAQPYLRLFDVELDREVELGKGPVDFKASSGVHAKLLVELKKEHNGKFWNGIEAQLPSYLQSDGSKNGWFVALRFRSNKASTLRLQQLPARVKEIAQSTGTNLKFSIIDARRKDSASNL